MGRNFHDFSGPHRIGGRRNTRQNILGIPDDWTFGRLGPVSIGHGQIERGHEKIRLQPDAGHPGRPDDLYADSGSQSGG